MPRPLTHKVATVLALLLTTLLGACTAGASSQSGDQDQNSLVVAFPEEPANLDFTTTAGAAIPQVLLKNVYEGLVTQNSSGQTVPLLAKDWTVSEDEKTYTFRLRQGVKFSNGDPFNAESVKFSIERAQSDAWAVPQGDVMDVVDKVNVLSPDTVEVVLSRPSNGWLYWMTTRVGAMFSPKGVDDLANDPVGTGPYDVARFTPGDSVLLKARSDYWGQAPAMQNVTFQYFKDPTAMANAKLTGEVDIIGDVTTPEALNQFKGDDRFEVIEGTTNGEVVLSFNNASGPLQDVRIRKAVKYALDRQAIMDIAAGGYGTLIGSMVPPTDPWYEDLTGLYPHDPEKARALLREAGAENLKLRLRLPSSSYAVAAGQVVKSQLAQVGIRADIDVLEFPAAWLDVVYTNRDYDMSIIEHVEPRDISHFANPDYYFGYDSERVPQLLASADTASEAQQVASMKAAARQIAEDAAADWLYLAPYLAVADAELSGVPRDAVTESFDVTAISSSS